MRGYIFTEAVTPGYSLECWGETALDAATDALRELGYIVDDVALQVNVTTGEVTRGQYYETVGFIH